MSSRFYVLYRDPTHYGISGIVMAQSYEEAKALASGRVATILMPTDQETYRKALTLLSQEGAEA